ncbi:hypothetical protein ARMGADRAFT_1081047 [Armillaria gallica]|uniref:Uncharacterized protein n=1 Tax=Armillaria gallica TaxID=47427 RepID=A0A2H3DN40_ARMGA|nr:hypothetical protein ARMGADRAFT_1081047 [Armillaria gallica]
MATYPSENRGAMLKATSFESILYGIHAILVVFTIWIVGASFFSIPRPPYTVPMPASVGRDQGRSCFIRCGLVIVMYLIATSPLALRSIFVQGINNDKTQETTYIYSPGWMLLSSASFMANILITNCIAIWRCWFLCDRRWMFSIIPGLCTIVGTVFASFCLYEMTTTPPPGKACAAQINWMLPYYSMSLAVTILCTAVILYRTVMGPRIGRRICRLWINVIVESSLLFAVGPIVFLVVYIKSDMRTSCPLLVVTMSTSSAPILAVARVPSNTAMQEYAPLELRTRLETEGLNAGSTSGGNRGDSVV